MKRITLDKVINLLMFLYVLSIYVFTFREGLNVISNSIAFLLAFAIWTNVLLSKKPIVFNKILLIYLLFIFSTIISVFYAIDQNVVISRVITLILIYILMISLVNYINTVEKIMKLLSYFVYSGFITSIYILLISDFNQINRLGSEVGNENAVGMIIGISSIFCFYFIFESKKKSLWIIILLTNLGVILLTGSRKALLLILFTFLILLLFRNGQRIKERLMNVLLGSILIIGFIYLVFNVPIFYEIIGHRVEDLIGFLKTGTEAGDASVNIRADMMTQGIKWFKEHPFIGYGIDNYKFLYGGIIGSTYSYSHNNFIELLVGIGLIGTFLFYFIQLIVIKDLYKISQNRSSRLNTLCICFISIIFIYILLSVGLVYYFSKHFSIILVIGSIIPRIISLESENSHKDYI